MTLLSVVMALLLVMVPLLVSKYQRLGIEKEILIGTVRALIQLMAIGYVLKYIFHLNDWKFTTLMLIIMTLVAGYNAAKRGKAIQYVFLPVTFSIALGGFITLFLLVILGIIRYTPSQVIPISGMIIGNSMVACALVLNQIQTRIKDKKQEIEAYLALGATSRQAVEVVLRNSVKSGMIPTFESMKTMGIVQLPGMMTGLILAGVSPLQAVRYQLIVVFMLSSAVAISCMSIALLAYRKFFTKAHQLKI